MVSKTMDDLPDPDTPVKIVILRFGMRNETFFRLFSRAPRIVINSWDTICSCNCHDVEGEGRVARGLRRALPFPHPQRRGSLGMVKRGTGSIPQRHRPAAARHKPLLPKPKA